MERLDFFYNVPAWDRYATEIIGYRSRLAHVEKYGNYFYAYEESQKNNGRYYKKLSTAIKKLMQFGFRQVAGQIA